ncbi:MAG: anaerobic ribonucleoside-triphosphate reductase activating protein, partial [Syntrophales bacterium]|nr:anaerobic ribonucleoside-triphosphate reductase activating protein [Syntrophales bacterium]
GKISATVFTQGCNFRCPYCHNPELVDPERYQECLPEDEIFSYLKKRRGKLEAVTITGGEPTIQNDLLSFAQRVRAMGYLVKVDTNGSKPGALEELIRHKLPDYIAMDIKAPLAKYAAVTRAPVKGETIRQSIEIIKASGINCEFRTTVVKSQLEEADILAIGALIKNAPLYVLQRYVPTKPLDEKFLSEVSFSQEELNAIRVKLEKNCARVVIR